MCYTYMNSTPNLLGNRLGALANAISDLLQRDLIPTQPVGGHHFPLQAVAHALIL